VTAADIEENVAAIDERELPVDVIQVDDGWHSGIGDWLTLSGRFSSLEALTVGLFDAMRVCADVAPHWAPLDGDPAQPSQQGAVFSTVGRAFQHGRF